MAAVGAFGLVDVVLSERLAGDCANICEIYMLFDVDGIAKTILMILHILLTAVVLTLLLIFTLYYKYF